LKTSFIEVASCTPTAGRAFRKVLTSLKHVEIALVGDYPERVSTWGAFDGCGGDVAGDWPRRRAGSQGGSLRPMLTMKLPAKERPIRAAQGDGERESKREIIRIRGVRCANYVLKDDV
jgi:hypothetical protein